jgi:hypothetical protein
MPPSNSYGISLFTNRNFLLLWVGQGLSVLGDQFALIGLPWLVLQVTGDPLALGTVLAIQSIPRALFMLVGGAVTDRFSARTVMLVSDLLRLALFGLLAAFTYAGQVQLWMLYVLALLFGLFSGFFNPASAAIAPRLVRPEHLQTANSLVQATAQLSTFLGPGLAAGLIALLSSQTGVGEAGPGLEGIALAFAVDAFSFLVSAVTLWMMRDDAVSIAAPIPGENMLSAIRAGIVYVWQTPFLRTAYLLIMAVNLFCVGPLEVGIPYLANTRLKEGVVAFGLIMAAYGGGNLAGILLAGTLPKPAPVILKRITVILVLVFGVGLVGLSQLTTTAVGFIIALIMGMGNGYLALSYITIIQRLTPAAMLGRMMSLLMLANLGLVPISQAVTGGLIQFSLQAVFIGAGILIFLVGLWAAARKELVVKLGPLA